MERLQKIEGVGEGEVTEVKRMLTALIQRLRAES